VKVVVAQDAAEVARRGAEILARLVEERPEAVVGLPTGRTAVPFYAALADLASSGSVDLGRVRAFNLDELILPPEHPASFHSFMEEHAWGRSGQRSAALQRERCAIPNGSAEDPAAECRRYEAAVQAAGGLDLVVLGVGEDGHVAYNLPGPPSEEAHVVELPEAVAHRLAVPQAWQPARAITLGLGALRASRRVLLMATGSSKARAVRSLLEGPEDPQWPCSLLRAHPAFDLVVDPLAFDPAAAAEEKVL